MAEERPATTGLDRKRTGASYVSQWNRFVAWCEESGSSSLPGSPEDVAAYLKDRWESGAKPSTLKVVAAAITRSHREAGFDVSAQQGVTRAVLEELTQDDSLGPTRALPLDLDCYLAIRKVAKEQRGGRGGHEERVSNARRRGALDVAMIGLMRDARLRVNEAAALTWGDLERVHGGSGRVRVADTDYRVLSADTMKLLSSVRRGAGDNESLLGMRPNQIAIRIGTAARQPGLGEGYSGESPRLGMIQDMETLGVLLLGSCRYASAPRPTAAGRPAGSGRTSGTQAYAPTRRASRRRGQQALPGLILPASGDWSWRIRTPPAATSWSRFPS